MTTTETKTLKDILEDYSDEAIALAIFQDDIIIDDNLDKEYSEESDEYEEITNALDQAEKDVRDETYLVLTDEEADEKWDEYLDNYLEECILSKIPERYQFYFDQDLWKTDARVDGSRGAYLATYDGYEHEQDYNGRTYYIYKQ